MTDRYRESIKHDIKEKLERGKGFDKVHVDAILEAANGKKYGVDVVALRERDMFAQCYLIPNGEGRKYVDEMKHKCIEIQNDFSSFAKNSYNLKFYILVKDKWVVYDPSN
jgi:hypothetical protein